MILSDDNYVLDTFTNKLQFTSELEKQFFTRIYTTPREVYDSRIKQINFIDKKNVLDAGCGYGQWTISLSNFNKNVCAIDLDPNKLKIAKKISTLESKYPLYGVGNIENLPFNDNQFDAVFSYSVIYWTDYKKSLREFYRVLKPKGFIYFVANGLGWSIFNLFSGHSSASDYNARKVAIDTIFQTFRYSLTGKKKKNSSLFLSPKKVSDFMRNIGFKNVMIAEEGHLKLLDNVKTSSFYPKKYFGLDNVFEIWGEK